MLKTKQIIVSSVLAFCGIAVITITIGCGDGMDDIKAKMAARARRNAKQAEKEIKDNANGTSTKPATQSQESDPSFSTTNLVETVEANSTTPKADATETNSVQPASELTESEHRKRVIENLGRIGAAIEAMRRDGNGSFPVLGYHNNSSSDTGLSWRVRLLPYLGYDELYKKFDFSKPYYADVNMDAAKSMPKEFQDSRDPGSGRTRIQAVSGSGTAFGSIGGRALSKKLMEEEGINRANFAVIIETTPKDAINWIEPNDLEIDLNDPVPLELVYVSGILSIWGDGKVYELNPDLSGKDQMLAFRANERKSKRRKAFAHRAVADPVVLAEEQAAAEQEQALTTAAAVIDPKLSNAAAEEYNETQIVIPGDRDSDDEDVKVAKRISRSSLVFSSYESYFNNERFGDAWSMHLASLLLSDDSLTQRFKWSESLGRPMYGVQVGFAIDGAEKLDNDATISFDILDDIDQNLPFHKEVFNALGAPGPKALEILRDFAADGSLGPWAQVASRNSTERINTKVTRKIRSKVANEQGNYCPSVKFYSEGTGTKYFVDLAQRDDLDLLVLVTVTSSKNDTELALSVFDVQRRKRLYESFVLRKSNIDKWKEDPLSIDPASKWLEEFKTAMKSILTFSELPKISVQAARNRLRELIAQTSTRVSLNEFLETKFYLDLGLISGIEYEKVAAKWSEKGEANSLNARDTFLRLEGIESFLPKDWEKPIDEAKNKQVELDD